MNRWLAFLLFAQGMPVGAEAQWQVQQKLSAPEAHQAASADQHFVYAITSDGIAKYDRKSGKRVAISKGAAKHLNSGFFWKGKLLCAHSNYPLKPERSEIKVLDTDSMQLTTFKDLGSAGGSLTWVLHKDGFWWCNFALYGADNHKTFLVKYDEQWREVARWTYPAKVISQLGRHSLSGGIWRGEQLWTTGHDDPVAFRLGLPKEGSELEYLGQHVVPFTGQGLANDPVSGGLVGINRAKRQVIFSGKRSEPVRLRVLCYNIHHAEGVDGKLDVPRIARVILSVNPDLVALQEMDQKTKRTRKVDQVAELARLTKMNSAFGANIEFQGGKYGNAILSRFPITRHKNHHLPNMDSGEQRGLLESIIKISEKDSLLFLATHLDHRRPDKERLASAKFINRIIGSQDKVPAILAGDFNDVPGSPTLKEFSKSWVRTNPKMIPTVPVTEPVRQIDYILVRPKDRWKVVETRVLDESVASDHRAIFAVIELVD
ncbi:MAG: endonuclease/exonuclease/phosphatase family protein [Verrucomicrobiales bacterium]|nr:endonuclease/exonuclease/phosphatase family protein [Verrucomicrobiales bacterium]